MRACVHVCACVCMCVHVCGASPNNITRASFPPSPLPPPHLHPLSAMRRRCRRSSARRALHCDSRPRSARHGEGGGGSMCACACVRVCVCACVRVCVCKCTTRTACAPFRTLVTPRLLTHTHTHSLTHSHTHTHTHCGCRHTRLISCSRGCWERWREHARSVTPCLQATGRWSRTRQRTRSSPGCSSDSTSLTRNTTWCVVERGWGMDVETSG